MAELQNPDPLVEAVAQARAAVSQRPDIKFPIGNLNIVDGQVYAYSGVVSHSTTLVDYLNFVTMSDTIVCTVHITGDYDSIGANDVLTNVYFNERQILIDDSSAELAPYSWPVKLVIPPYTKVRIEGKVSSGSGKNFCCILVGETK